MDNSGPAFPSPCPDMRGEAPNVFRADYAGMTLRDYFAGQALIGMMQENDVMGNTSAYAQMVYEIADAMLQERSK